MIDQKRAELRDLVARFVEATEARLREIGPECRRLTVELREARLLLDALDGKGYPPEPKPRASRKVGIVGQQLRGRDAH